MKQKITLGKLVITWSDGKTEDLANVLPEYLREELEVYFDELEDLRLEMQELINNDLENYDFWEWKISNDDSNYNFYHEL